VSELAEAAAQQAQAVAGMPFLTYAAAAAAAAYAASRARAVANAAAEAASSIRAVSEQAAAILAQHQEAAAGEEHPADSAQAIVACEVEVVPVPRAAAAADGPVNIVMFLFALNAMLVALMLHPPLLQRLQQRRVLSVVVLTEPEVHSGSAAAQLSSLLRTLRGCRQILVQQPHPQQVAFPRAAVRSAVLSEVPDSMWRMPQSLPQPQPQQQPAAAAAAAPPAVQLPPSAIVLPRNAAFVTPGEYDLLAGGVAQLSSSIVDVAAEQRRVRSSAAAQLALQQVPRSNAAGVAAAAADAEATDRATEAAIQDLQAETDAAEAAGQAPSEELQRNLRAALQARATQLGYREWAQWMATLPWAARIRVIFLGTSGSEPLASRGNSGILVQVQSVPGEPDVYFLLDAGTGCLHALYTYCRDEAQHILGSISLIFVSHAHRDHNGGVGSVLEAMPADRQVLVVGVDESLRPARAVAAARPGTVRLLHPSAFYGPDAQQPFLSRLGLQLRTLWVPHGIPTHALMMRYGEAGSPTSWSIGFTGEQRACSRVFALPSAVTAAGSALASTWQQGGPGPKGVVVCDAVIISNASVPAALNMRASANCMRAASRPLLPCLPAVLQRTAPLTRPLWALGGPSAQTPPSSSARPRTQTGTCAWTATTCTASGRKHLWWHTRWEPASE
jgi:hypothetical protein